MVVHLAVADDADHLGHMEHAPISPVDVHRAHHAAAEVFGCDFYILLHPLIIGNRRLAMRNGRRTSTAPGPFMMLPPKGGGAIVDVFEMLDGMLADLWLVTGYLVVSGDPLDAKAAMVLVDVAEQLEAIGDWFGWAVHPN